MTRARRARRIAAAAICGGGSIGLLGAATYGLLVAQTRLARRSIGPWNGEPPVADGFYGDGDGPPINFAVLGDSTAAGLGVHEAQETPGALLAVGLSALAERPVRLINVAKSGARSSDLDWQVTQALLNHPTIVVIMVGANDVINRIRPSLSVRHLASAVRRLRAAGCDVVVGTCPDLGTVEPIGQPLRWVARRLSRELAAAQTIAVVEAGGRTVSLTDLLGPEFAAAPREMFGPDRFHPSARGYASAAAAVLPSLGAAVGLWPEAEGLPDRTRGEGVLPIYLAAAEAAEEPGTEVAAARVEGRARGPRGPWAILLRRRQRGPRTPQRETGRQTRVSG